MLREGIGFRPSEQPEHRQAGCRRRPQVLLLSAFACSELGAAAVSHGADIPELNFCSLLIMLLLSLIRGAICIILVKLTISKPRLRVKKAQYGEWKFAIERLSLAIILYSSVLLCSMD